MQIRIMTAAVGFSCLFAHQASAAEFPATFTGGSNYNNAANWTNSNGMVPLNNLTDQFNVTIPTGFTVNFDVAAPSQINDFTLAPSSSFTVSSGRSLTVLDATSIGGQITVSGASSLLEAAGAGAAFQASGPRLIVTSGGTLHVAAASFTNTSFGSGTQFSADGAGSLLNLSSLQSYTDTADGSGPTLRTVSATNNGVIDMHNVGTITKSNNNDVLEFRANSGGDIILGNLNTSGGVRFSADGSGSELDLRGNVNLKSPSTLTLTNAAQLTVGGDFLFNYTSEAAWNLNAGIMAVEGPNRHFLEVGSQDLGVSGATSGNFGIGQLVVGAESESSLAILTEAIDNGNRSGGREALYLCDSPRLSDSGGDRIMVPEGGPKDGSERAERRSSSRAFI